MKSLKIYSVIASAILIIYLIAQYNKPKPVDWTETSRNTDKIPFGTYILYHRLNDIFPGAVVKPCRQSLYAINNEQPGARGTYILICNSANISARGYQKLIQFLNKGNEVFIAAAYFGPAFRKELAIETNSELNLNTSVKINILKSYQPAHTYTVDRNCTATYFSRFDTSKASVAGNNEFKHANFLEFKIGKGVLYLNSNPLMFSNYSLLQKPGAAYAGTALSCLENRKNLLWDEFYTRKGDSDDSPMRVFLTHTALRYAYYIAFFSLLLFVLYDIKRRQRIIPIITPLSNTTVEFANIVGQLYYEQHNNTDIARKKLAYLLEHVRSRYNLKTTELNADFVKLLAQKSGVSSRLISQIMEYNDHLQQENITLNDNELIKVNHLIEEFYAKSR